MMRPIPAQNLSTEPTDLDSSDSENSQTTGPLLQTHKGETGLTFQSWISLLAVWSRGTLRACQAWASLFTLHACRAWRDERDHSVRCSARLSKGHQGPWCFMNELSLTSRFQAMDGLLDVQPVSLVQLGRRRASLIS